MIEIETKDWPIGLWYKAVQWCLDTFGPLTFGTEWFWQDDYSLYLSEKNVTLFVLRWANYAD
jgi:hypothetical protein